MEGYKDIKRPITPIPSVIKRNGQWVRDNILPENLQNEISEISSDI